MLVCFNKPFNVLSQFSDADGHAGLKRFISLPNIYPAGRLDLDSEGLLLLTDDGPLAARITDPKHKLEKTYVVQVDGQIDVAALAKLSKGVLLNDGMTRPALAIAISEPDWLWPRTPPVRYRAAIPTSWLSLSIREGRNRQVRRMTAAVGFPTLRLIRVAIGEWLLADLPVAQWRVVDFAETQAR